MRAETAKDEGGRSTQQQRWRRHFKKVLNIESVFSDSKVECQAVARERRDGRTTQQERVTWRQ